jgi:aspartyl-tRNA(Asn)/glutamyl-tRNA(Gln) amidotransferase subunit C
MALTTADLHRIAHLARLTLSDAEATRYGKELSTILDLVAQMGTVDTKNVPALAHSLDLTQRVRADRVTEPDQRDACQAIAPAVDAGLYLVPKVIETVADEIA